MKDNSGSYSLRLENKKNNSNSANKVSVEPKVEPEPQPRRAESEEKGLVEYEKKNANFYIDLYCAILMTERVGRKEAESLFMSDVARLKVMRERNSDKLIRLMYGEFDSSFCAKLSDEDLFIYVVKKIKKGQKQGCIFKAVMSYSI